MTEISFPLPATVRTLIAQVPAREQHPGLVVTKLASSWQIDSEKPPGVNENIQQQMLRDLQQAVSPTGLSEPFKQAWIERNYLLQSLGQTDHALVCFDSRTRSPLAAHLAKMTVGENAGLALHPIHGFPCLPASGLKGLAHHYAALHWLPKQNDLPAAWSTLLRIFGYAPSPWFKKLACSLARLTESGRDTFPPPEDSCSGSVVFLDAWPKDLPGVLTDIIACHHPKYYSQAQTGPGDWENPNLVSFPTVPSGKPFSFALFAGRTAQPDDVPLAALWLDHALQILGFGAKTNAGYGRFTPAKFTQDLPQEVTTAITLRPRCCEQQFQLQLTSPGFFAGNEQTAEDCVLRVPSLRGRLRTYWRMLHAGFVDVQTLAKLEAAVWGSSSEASPLSIDLQQTAAGRVVRFSPSSYASFNNQQKASAAGIPGAEGGRVRQGLAYITYGMSEATPARCVMLPGAQWSMRVTAHPSRFGDTLISADQIMTELRSAMFLLGYYGSVGSKASRGFGSLQIEGDTKDQAQCEADAAQFRDYLGLDGGLDVRKLDSPSLHKKLEDLEIDFPWSNVWAVMDQVGFSIHAWCLGKINDYERGKLGLPRNFGPNTQGDLNPDIQGGINGRHSSPVQVHLDKTSNGYKVRIAFLPSTRLPNLEQSTEFLQGIRAFLEKQLESRSKLHVQKLYAAPRITPSAPRIQPTSRLESKQQVRAVLLEERTKRGGWRVSVVNSDITGFIQNHDQVPSDKKAGDEIVVEVVNPVGVDVAFRIPTAKDSKKSPSSGKSPKGSGK